MPPSLSGAQTLSPADSLPPLGSPLPSSHSSPNYPSPSASPSRILQQHVAKCKRHREELDAAAKRTKIEGCTFCSSGKHVGRALTLFGNVEKILRDGRECFEVEDVEEINEDE
ncbi:hypothetical protein DACRYDRAFT_111077 [Dacryopinax primogenitus]|uniref:Uncharacterized protein n=1 Tax=Dacryopinax primogenitus (strain DJM 731) TaxID=1858805 RepID=M5FX93_DACPD|nr:uncharacterized protein DACRYDRAFT_111077 [Dacryopinax primogenitus]EJT98096.1 hypothetical protein DACRYDRAFT_111077 [Dacryopinax primogenitus]